MKKAQVVWKRRKMSRVVVGVHERGMGGVLELNDRRGNLSRTLMIQAILYLRSDR